jgi:hypothetical protein
MDMMWHLSFFMASNFDAHKKSRNLVNDLLFYLDMTLTPLSNELSRWRNSQRLQTLGLEAKA